MRLAFLRVALLAFGMTAESSVSADPAPPAPFGTAYRRLMGPAGLGPVDFDLLINYRTEIPRTLPAVETLLRRPQSVDSLIPALRNSLGSDTLDRVDFSLALWPWLNVQPYSIVYFAEPSSEDWTRQAEQNLLEYVKPLSVGEVNYLRTEVPPMLVFSIEDTSLNPIESETRRLRGDAILDSLMRLTGKLPSTKNLADASHAIEQLRSKSPNPFVEAAPWEK